MSNKKPKMSAELTAFIHQSIDDSSLKFNENSEEEFEFDFEEGDTEFLPSYKLDVIEGLQPDVREFLDEMRVTINTLYSESVMLNIQLFLLKRFLLGDMTKAADAKTLLEKCLLEDEEDFGDLFEDLEGGD